MPASLYKDSTITGNYSDRIAKMVRWLTGETQGELGTAGPGGNGATVRVLEAWDSITNSRSVSSDGTMDGLSADSRWRDPSLGVFTFGWIVLEFDGTGINGNVGFQVLWQLNGQRISTTCVIPRKDWNTSDGATSALFNETTAAAETTSGLITNLIGTNPLSYEDSIFYAWADNGMFMLCHDDTTRDRGYWMNYVGEVDSPAAGDAYPFVSCRSYDPNDIFIGSLASGSQAVLSRISPVDGTTRLIQGRPMTFNITVDSDPWNTGPTLSDFGGYFPSPISIAFGDVGHYHIAGNLRYVQATHRDLGGRFTAESLNKIGWALGSYRNSLPIGGWVMDWDGTTPHP